MYARSKFGPWSGSVARALGVPSKSRELASNHGVAFRLAEQRRTMETPL